MPGQESRAWSAGVLRWLLPILISGLALFLVLRNVNFTEIKLAFSKIPAGLLLLMILIFLIGLWLRSLSWKIILGPNYSIKTAFLGINAGYLLNNILPFRLGEIGRALLLSGQGKDKGPFMEIIAAILTERILDIILAAFFFLLTLPLIAESATLQNLAWIALVMMIVLVLLVSLGAKHHTKVIAFLDRKFGNYGFFQSTLIPHIKNLLFGFNFFLIPKRWVPAVVLLFTSWVMAMLQLWSLQRVLIPEGLWWWPVLIVSAGSFINALPSAPAGLGVLEAAIVGAYVLLKVDQSTGLAVALILHAIQFIIPSIFGVIGIYLLGENLASLVKRASLRKQQRKELP